MVVKKEEGWEREREKEKEKGKEKSDGCAEQVLLLPSWRCKHSATEQGKDNVGMASNGGFTWYGSCSLEPGSDSDARFKKVQRVYSGTSTVVYCVFSYRNTLARL